MFCIKNPHRSRQGLRMCVSGRVLVHQAPELREQGVGLREVCVLAGELVSATLERDQVSFHQWTQGFAELLATCLIDMVFHM